jgi:hypothetical protein
MVYLEWCYESCSNIWYNQNYPSLGRAVEPSCSAAILFTVQGARKVADLCLPIFDVIDRMYPILIRKVHRMLKSPSVLWLYVVDVLVGWLLRMPDVSLFDEQGMAGSVSHKARCLLSGVKCVVKSVVKCVVKAGSKRTSWSPLPSSRHCTRTRPYCIRIMPARSVSLTHHTTDILTNTHTHTHAHTHAHH